METYAARRRRRRAVGAGRSPGDHGRNGPGRRPPRPHPRAAALFDPPDPPDPAAVPAPATALPARERARLAAADGRVRLAMQPRALAALTVVLAVGAGLAVHHYAAGRPQTVTPPPPAVAASATPAAGASASASATATVVVDVAGKVRDPGVYVLPSGARVADAIEEAGGARPGTDTDTLNRARQLTDGEQIVVGGTPAPAPVPTAAGSTATSPISLNAATPEQLETLPGVGPVLAANIIAFRDEQGGFASVDQLLDVSGIGEGRLAEIRDHVTL